MRRGALVGTMMRAEANEARVISMMFGAEPPAIQRAGGQLREDAKPILELISVTTASDAGELHLDNISLSVRPHEIVGIAGVSGSGQKEIGDVILGLLPHNGVKRFATRDAMNWPIGRLREHGLSMIPENPLWMGVVGSMTVTENMALADRARYARTRRAFDGLERRAGRCGEIPATIAHTNAEPGSRGRNAFRR